MQQWAKGASSDAPLFPTSQYAYYILDMCARQTLCICIILVWAKLCMALNRRTGNIILMSIIGSEM